jgi:predicted AlkP superfamily pyrophosphatase or phosphodiesterase
MRESRTVAWRLLPGALVLLLALGALASGPKPAPPPPSVVLLTMDGVRWDALDRPRLPAFSEMAAGGLRAGSLIPPFPSLTFASHATLATGCLPARHGIVANVFLDSRTGRPFSDDDEASWLLEPPLWVLAERAGLRSAVSGWPCSQGPWQGVSASVWVGFDSRRSDAQTVEWILKELGRPARERPRLVMAWTRGADGAGHAHGPGSPEAAQAVRAADRTLARLRDGLKALGPCVPVDLIVASDHGMGAASRVIDPAAFLPKRGFYPFIAASGPLCNVYVESAKQREQVARALKRLPEDVRWFSRDQLPQALHYDAPGRTGDFVLLAPPGAFFKSFKDRGKHASPRGMHGYDPAEDGEMRGIFLAEGPDVPAGSYVAEARAVDVAPTVCALLRIPPPPHADGRSLAGHGRSEK